MDNPVPSLEDLYARVEAAEIFATRVAKLFVGFTSNSAELVKGLGRPEPSAYPTVNSALKRLSERIS